MKFCDERIQKVFQSLQIEGLFILRSGYTKYVTVFQSLQIEGLFI